MDMPTQLTEAMLDLFGIPNIAVTYGSAKPTLLIDISLDEGEN